MDTNDILWLNLTIRWIHIIAGIAWIGASFYFNWLEGNLNRQTKSPELEGDLWAVHGGGFYHVLKLKGAPKSLPQTLHWFKWEAYLTWISGFFLLSLVYYWGADTYLIDSQKAALSSLQASAIGVLNLLVSWMVYDLICRSKLAHKTHWLSVIILLYFVISAFILCQIFTGRGAYIHIGAAIGTIMAANVFMIIIPNQKALVSALMENRLPDNKKGERALQRSLHNNYFTLPVLFIMISNHYPMTYAHEYNWLILLCLSLIGILTRHHFNLKNRSKKNAWLLPLAGMALVALALVSKVDKSSIQGRHDSFNTPIKFSAIKSIIKKRCATCHSENPSDDIFKIAPNGLMLDSPIQIKNMVPLIKDRVINTHSMPLANKTKMTMEERNTLEQWIISGADIN